MSETGWRILQHTAWVIFPLVSIRLRVLTQLGVSLPAGWLLLNVAVQAKWQAVAVLCSGYPDFNAMPPEVYAVCSNTADGAQLLFTFIFGWLPLPLWCLLVRGVAACIQSAVQGRRRNSGSGRSGSSA